MAFETVLGMSSVKSDIFHKYRGAKHKLPMCPDSPLIPSYMKGSYIRTAWIGRLGRAIEMGWNAYSLMVYNKTLEQYWYDNNYNEDGTAKY